jgi:type VI secretion system protein ImpM
MSRPSTVRLAWFGKVASRGDFVRSAQNGALTQMLDHWLTQGLELLSVDAQWKHFYDRAEPTHFAFLSVRARQALAGHMIPSADASGRRFPFVVTGAFEVDHPTAFMGHAPIALTRLWSRLEQVARQTCEAQDAASVLQSISQRQPDIEVSPAAYAASFRDFVEMQTVGSLEGLLKSAHGEVDLRQLLLALGMLLQPVPASGKSQLDVGLRLPLPGDALYAPLVGALWLHLAAPFLQRGDFELAIFSPGARSVAQASPPWLSIGFAGGAAATLQAMFDTQKAVQAFVTLSTAEWVEEQVSQDYAVKKLSSYLQQPQLSLAQALATFKECFLGA